MEAVAFSEPPVAERAEFSTAVRLARAEVRGVDLAFGGQKVLHGATFDLRPGELALLRGENGSGKTVLLNVLSGYIAPDRGSVRFQLGGDWVDVTRASPESLARRGVGRLWQDIRLFPTMTVLDNVLAATARRFGAQPGFLLLALPAVLREERRARERALQNLALVGMADRARSSCDMLSVGQMKRVALARLLQMEASLLLLDEPFAGLDAAAVASFALDLQRLQKERGKTILVVEHRHEAISRAADHVWTMKNGRIEESETGRA
jgi:branched-chain amino acid transport system ATP-binding protein